MQCNEHKIASAGCGEGGEMMPSSNRELRLLRRNQLPVYPIHPEAKFSNFVSDLLGRVCKKEDDITLFRSSW